MKIQNIFLTVCFIGVFGSTLCASSQGEELFEQKCMMCHKMSRSSDLSSMVAPPAKGLMFHMSQSFSSEAEMLAHIQSFVIKPTQEKAICRSVKRFGLMPSQRDNVTDEELNTIAHWMVQNLKMTKHDHQMRKQMGNGQGKGMGRN